MPGQKAVEGVCLHTLASALPLRLKKRTNGKFFPKGFCKIRGMRELSRNVPPLPASHARPFSSETVPAFIRTIRSALCPKAKSPCSA